MLKTTLQKTEPVVFRPYNHAANTAAVEATKAIQEMKRVAIETSMIPSEIYARGVRPLTDAVRVELPLQESVKRTLRNRRIQAPEPMTLSGLVIEGKLSVVE